MKTQIKNLFAVIIAITLFSNFLFAQCSSGVDRWCPSGNGNASWGNTLGTFWTSSSGANDINIFTNSAQRMRINGSANAATAGFIGIGPAFTAPLSLAHLHNSPNSSTIPITGLQITNSATTAGQNNGLQLGIDGSMDAYFNQYQNANMRFYTNGVANQRMIIEAGGKVGVNTTVAVQTNSQFEVNNDINLTSLS